MIGNDLLWFNQIPAEFAQLLSWAFSVYAKSYGES